jgi:hypothetical protein
MRALAAHAAAAWAAAAAAPRLLCCAAALPPPTLAAPAARGAPVRRASIAPCFTIYRPPHWQPAGTHPAHPWGAVLAEAGHLALAAVDDHVERLWRLPRVALAVGAARRASPAGFGEEGQRMGPCKSGSCHRGGGHQMWGPMGPRRVRKPAPKHTCRSSVNSVAPGCSTLPPFRWQPAHLVANASGAAAHAAEVPHVPEATTAAAAAAPAASRVTALQEGC